MRYLIALLALAGLVVSSMALRIHFMDPAAAPPCAVSEHWDCGSVNHGKYSVFPPLSFDEQPGAVHIPVAAMGIVGYALIAVFALDGEAADRAGVGAGWLFCAAMLTYIEAYIITKWCIYCVWSQGIIAAIVLVTVAALLLRRRRRAQSMRDVLLEQVD